MFGADLALLLPSSWSSVHGVQTATLNIVVNFTPAVLVGSKRWCQPQALVCVRQICHGMQCVLCAKLVRLKSRFWFVSQNPNGQWVQNDQNRLQTCAGETFWRKRSDITERHLLPPDWVKEFSPVTATEVLQLQWVRPVE